MDPTDENEDDMNIIIMEDRNAGRCKYSKSITKYEIGAIISKHCAPWGENALLHNVDFSLSKFIYKSNGKISAAIVIERERGAQYKLDPAFFLGWCDKDALNRYFTTG